MKRTLNLLVVAPSLVILAAALAAGGEAKTSRGAATAAGPFYLVPSATNECKGVTNCKAVTGPWVVVPADGQATFLFGCNLRRGFVVRGADARASSANVRVWFDGRLGTTTGFPPSSSKGSAVLLFHAVANNRTLGSFQPTLGCVSLTQAGKRSTVSARRAGLAGRAGALPGTTPGSPLDLRASKVLLTQTAKLRITTGCPKNERLVGSWGAIAFATTGPPGPAYLRAATIKTVVAGNKVHAVLAVKSLLFVPLAPQAWAQIGAMCEP